VAAAAPQGRSAAEAAAGLGPELRRAPPAAAALQLWPRQLAQRPAGSCSRQGAAPAGALPGPSSAGSSVAVAVAAATARQHQAPEELLGCAALAKSAAAALRTVQLESSPGLASMQQLLRACTRAAEQAGLSRRVLELDSASPALLRAAGAAAPVFGPTAAAAGREAPASSARAR
jgi:hypothetical protein